MEFWDESSPEKFPMSHPKGEPLKQEDGLELLAKQQQNFLIYLKHLQRAIQCHLACRKEKKLF